MKDTELQLAMVRAMHDVALSFQCEKGAFAAIVASPFRKTRGASISVVLPGDDAHLAVFIQNQAETLFGQWNWEQVHPLQPRRIYEGIHEDACTSCGMFYGRRITLVALCPENINGMHIINAALDVAKC